MNFGLSKKHIDEVTAALMNYPDVEEVIVFGSRAMGNFKTGSDVDLALKGRIGATTVNRISRTLNSESRLPYIFDVINYHDISNADLKKHIDEHGKRLYRRGS